MRWILFTLCLAVAATLLVSSGSNLYFGLQSRNWPRVEASNRRHTRERIQTIDTGEGQIADRNVVVTFRSYKYSVDLKDYVGDRLNYSAFWGTLPDDDTVMVSYDPDDPSRAVLEPGIRWRPFVLDATLRCGTAGILLLFVWRRRPRARR